MTDSHLCPGHNVLGQPLLGKGFLASVVQEPVVANMGLLVSRDGCKVMLTC